MKILRYYSFLIMAFLLVSCLTEEESDKEIKDNPQIANSVTGVWSGKGDMYIQCMYLRSDRTMVNALIDKLIFDLYSGFYSSWKINEEALYVWDETSKSHIWTAYYTNGKFTGLDIGPSSMIDLNYSKIYDPTTGKATTKLPSIVDNKFNGACHEGMITLSFKEKRVVRIVTNAKTGDVTEKEYLWKKENNVIRFSDDGGTTWPDNLFGISIYVSPHNWKYIFVDLGDIYTFLCTKNISQI